MREHGHRVCRFRRLAHQPQFEEDDSKIQRTMRAYILTAHVASSYLYLLDTRQYLTSDYFTAAVNGSVRRRNSYSQSRSAAPECMYIIHMMCDDTRHGRYVIFKPFIWWHDVIEPHKESLCRNTHASIVKMEWSKRTKKGGGDDGQQTNKDET